MLLETKSESAPPLALAKRYRDAVFVAMSELRLLVDEFETMVPRKHWTLPPYAEIRWLQDEE